MDIALFSLISIALLLWRTVPVAAAAMLSPMFITVPQRRNCYPIFGCPPSSSREIELPHGQHLYAAVSFAVYCIYSFKDIVHVAHICDTRRAVLVRSANSARASLSPGGRRSVGGPPALKQLLAALPLGFLAMAIVVRVRRRIGPSVSEPLPMTATAARPSRWSAHLPRTFVTANNFDYRLVFLLLTLPQLFGWAAMPDHRLSSLAATALLSIVTLLWVGSLSERLHLWDELASWIVAGELTALLAVTLLPVGSIRQTIMVDLPSVGSPSTS
jgi:hypothetical protein